MLFEQLFLSKKIGQYLKRNTKILIKMFLIVECFSKHETRFLKSCFFRVNITKDGKKALLALANGDMRRVLNVLQVYFHVGKRPEIILCRSGISRVFAQPDFMIN